MNARGLFLALLLVAGTAGALWDLRAVETRSVVVYSTAALKDLLEKDVVPRFEKASGYRVELVYVPAGQQYNRLQMSRGHQEADVFLHASPLYIARGASEGFFQDFVVPQDARVPATLKAPNGTAGRAWYAFAWSPVVEVYSPRFSAPPDLATLDATFGFPHPQLSNNGVYAVLLYEQVAPAAGQRALAHTRVQPANARANIGGVADGSFDVTLGYEAVVLTFQAQGAKVAAALPVVEGKQVTTRVLLTAGLLQGAKPGGEALVRFLFDDATQQHLGAYDFRPAVDAGNATGQAPRGGADVAAARVLDYDWSQWRSLDESLGRYVVQ